MIRWLFFLLLLINLLLLLAAQRQPGPESDQLPPLPPGVPDIQLMSESRAGAKTAAGQKARQDSSLPTTTRDSAESAGPEENKGFEKDAATEDAQVTSMRENEEPVCLQLGPFTQRADTAQLLWELSEEGLNAEVRQEVERRSNGFWVLVPTHGVAVTTMIGKLKAAGIEDVWRFSKGELVDVLSLGLYSDRNRAETRVAALSAKGFEAEIHPREVEEESYWVQLKHARDYADAKLLLDRIFEAHPSFRFPPPPCGNIANQKAVP